MTKSERAYLNQSVVAYLVVDDAKRAIDFYGQAFGAERLTEPLVGRDGRIGHVELRVGDTVFMLADAYPEYGIQAPKTLGGTPVSFMINVADAAAATDRAVAAGAELTRPVADQFYGDRSGEVTDPFGYRWSLSQHLEDVPSDELARRWAAMQEGDT